MSVNTCSNATDAQLSQKALQLAEYLLQEVSENGGELYIKGKFISGDVGLSPKEIGQLMPQLQEKHDRLDVERWSYTSATTWRVQLPRIEAGETDTIAEAAD